jgi:hypothetical protein
MNSLPRFPFLDSYLILRRPLVDGLGLPFRDCAASKKRKWNARGANSGEKKKKMREEKGGGRGQKHNIPLQRWMHATERNRHQDWQTEDTHTKKKPMPSSDKKKIRQAIQIHPCAPRLPHPHPQPRPRPRPRLLLVVGHACRYHAPFCPSANTPGLYYCAIILQLRKLYGWQEDLMQG